MRKINKNKLELALIVGSLFFSGPQMVLGMVKCKEAYELRAPNKELVSTYDFDARYIREMKPEERKRLANLKIYEAITGFGLVASYIAIYGFINF